jgi:hypothetical protein
VDALRRKLEAAREMAHREREKRREVSAAARDRIAEHVARNKVLRRELVETRRALAQQDAGEKEAERERAEAEKMERAREAAVAKFVERWDRDYLKKAGKKQAKRGRPRRKRRTKKSAA